jgi:tetratricopeptide (TPR) repeat protein
LGKTREVGMLARALCAEGTTVLLLRRDGWLDVPAEWPQGLRHKNLLFVIDDITFHCAKQAQHPRAGEMVTVGMPAFQERLHRTLDWFASACGEQEVRVLATARDEPGYWEKLDFSERDSLWRRFTCYRLQEPQDAAVARLLEEAARQAGIPADPGEFPAIAATNDSTFSNAVENLRRAQREGRLTLADYLPHAQDTWAASYRAAVRKHLAAKYVYDALDLLIQAGMGTRGETAVELSARLWGGGRLRRPLRRRQVRRALDALVADHVLAESAGAIRPRDGQVEAKGYALALAESLPFLTDLALWTAGRWREDAAGNIYRLGGQLWRAGEYNQAARLLKRGVQVAPDEAGLYHNLGNVYMALDRYKEAIATFQRAAELAPNNAGFHNDLGIAHLFLGQYEEAIAAFQRAITLEPENSHFHHNLGRAHHAQGRCKEAIVAYRRALQLAPGDTAIHIGLAGAYRCLTDLAKWQHHLTEAQQATRPYDQYNLARLESIAGNVDTALAHLAKAFEQEQGLRTWARRDPDLDFIRDDPRFRELVGEE